MLPDKTGNQSFSGFLLTSDAPLQFAISLVRSCTATVFLYDKNQSLVRAQVFYTVARIICICCCIRSSAMPEVAESPEHCCKTGIARTSGC